MAKSSDVILVHGAWADGSSWAKVIPLLAARGHSVTAVQLPLTSLGDDVAMLLGLNDDVLEFEIYPKDPFESLDVDGVGALVRIAASISMAWRGSSRARMGPTW